MIKQVIVIRKDLGMRKGKMAAQAAHASMEAMRKIVDIYGEAECSRSVAMAAEDSDILRKWLDEGMTKIVVGARSLDELIQLHYGAFYSCLPCGLIRDLGRTEFGEQTLTALGIGPDHATEIDALTRDLPLL